MCYRTTKNSISSEFKENIRFSQRSTYLGHVSRKIRDGAGSTALTLLGSEGGEGGVKHWSISRNQPPSPRPDAAGQKHIYTGMPL